jgi:hypothetical protein
MKPRDLRAVETMAQFGFPLFFPLLLFLSLILVFGPFVGDEAQARKQPLPDESIHERQVEL